MARTAKRGMISPGRRDTAEDQRTSGGLSSTGSRAVWASGILAAPPPVRSLPTLRLSQQREARAGSLTRWRGEHLCSMCGLAPHALAAD